MKRTLSGDTGYGAIHYTDRQCYTIFRKQYLKKRKRECRDNLTKIANHFKLSKTMVQQAAERQQGFLNVVISVVS
jgi:hypothetical protein